MDAVDYSKGGLQRSKMNGATVVPDMN